MLLITVSLFFVRISFLKKDWDLVVGFDDDSIKLI